MKHYFAVACAFSFLLPVTVVAENRVEIAAGALSNIRGNLGLNLIAGDQNQQNNAAAIALGSGTAVIRIAQQNVTSTLQGGHQEAIIQSTALSNSQGLIAINQGAGSANQQLNVFALSLSEGGALGGVVTDFSLSSTFARPAEGQEVTQTTTTLSLNDGALSNSKGVIQINQVAGQRNQGVNLVSLPLTSRTAVSP